MSILADLSSTYDLRQYILCMFCLVSKVETCFIEVVIRLLWSDANANWSFGNSKVDYHIALDDVNCTERNCTGDHLNDMATTRECVQ